MSFHCAITLIVPTIPQYYTYSIILHFKVSSYIKHIIKYTLRRLVIIMIQQFFKRPSIIVGYSRCQYLFPYSFSIEIHFIESQSTNISHCFFYRFCNYKFFTEIRSWKSQGGVWKYIFSIPYPLRFPIRRIRQAHAPVSNIAPFRRDITLIPNHHFPIKLHSGR